MRSGAPGTRRLFRTLPHGSSPSLRGFTLIELLVVVAIIGLLAAMLLPALNRARDRGRTVACLSNVRGLGQAVMFYVSDFSGLMPASSLRRSGVPYAGPYSRWDLATEPLGQAAPIWADALLNLQYVTRGALDCPAVPSDALAGTSYVEPTTNGLEYSVNLFTYDNNGNIHGTHGGTAPNVPWPLDWITKPSEGFYIADSQAPSWTCFYLAPWMGNHYEFVNGAGRDGRLRHNGLKAINVLMFDGHAVTWDCYREIFFDRDPYYIHFGFPIGMVYSTTVNSPTPLWRPWKPYF